MTAVVGVTAPAEITLPGVYLIEADIYHADPVPQRLGGSLSVSGAKKLLPPNCPAVFNYERQHGRPPKAVFDFGHAAHELVLGIGAGIVSVDADSWRTKASQEAKAAAYAEGKVPLKAADVAVVEAMADAIREHPIASVLLNPDGGEPEQALFRQDEQEGVWLRSMLDWLPHAGDGRMVIPDYKTAISASPSEFAKAAAKYKYHMQDAFYRDMVVGLGLADEVAFVFIVQEKAPPYLVTVVELDSEAVRIGRELNREAIDLYAQCESSGVWPGYSSEVELVSLPAWATYGRGRV
jgi:PDDEXK-like domain of unknown function (DUF3799)